jgi:hypothetical protein
MNKKQKSKAILDGFETVRSVIAHDVTDARALRMGPPPDRHRQLLAAMVLLRLIRTARERNPAGAPLLVDLFKMIGEAAGLQNRMAVGAAEAAVAART